MRVPHLRRHKTGQWFTHWGGKNRYFGTDKRQAEKRYLLSLEGWQTWKRERKAHAPAPSRSVPLVIEVVEKFLSAKRQELGLETAEYYERRLRRFVSRYGEFRVDWIKPEHLHNVKVVMLAGRQIKGVGPKVPYAPKTINHDLTAVRVLFHWAAGLGLAPPISLAGVKNLPLGPPPDKSMTEAAVREMVRTASEKLAPWLAVNYLALLRPSEVVRVVHGEGNWTETGIFRLDRGKMDRRSSFPRHCIFSPCALGWLKKCRCIWSMQHTYGNAVRNAFVGISGPARLRHSAASHLILKRNVSAADVELALGHVRSRLAVTYYRPAWRRLRAKVALLRL